MSIHLGPRGHLGSRLSQLSLGLLLAGFAACGTTTPAVPPAPPPAPAPVVVAPPPPPPAVLELTDAAVARPALVASLVTVAPNRIVADLDGLSRRLQLPMLFGRELLSAMAGTGLMGTPAQFQSFWDRLDPAAAIAVVWVMPPKLPAARGFCALLTFREPDGARATFESMGTAGGQRDGAFERRTPDGDVLWGAVRGRALLVASSPETLRFAGGLAEATQGEPPMGQVVTTILPPALVAASGKTRAALVADATALMTEQADSQRNMTPASRRMVAGILELGAKIALDSSAIRLVGEVGPNDGVLWKGELVPETGSPFATYTGRRAPFALDAKLPLRDDGTAVVAMGNPSESLLPMAKIFAASGPAGKELWETTRALFAATGEWSCVGDVVEVGMTTLCSAPLKSGSKPKGALDAALAMVKGQQAWEAELFGQKPGPAKIKRAGNLIEIEKPIENRDKLGRAIAKAMAGGELARTAITVKDGRLLFATGREPRKVLARYGTQGSGQSAPLVEAALARAKGSELFVSLDVVGISLAMLSKNKDMPGSQLAAMATAVPGVLEMKAPFVMSLRGGASLLGDFRIPLGTLDNVAKVVRGLLGPSQAAPAP